MTSQIVGKKSRQPARSRGNDPRSLKRKRGVDELASLKRTVEELVRSPYQYIAAMHITYLF